MWAILRPLLTPYMYIYGKYIYVSVRASCLVRAHSCLTMPGSPPVRHECVRAAGGGSHGAPSLKVRHALLIPTRSLFSRPQTRRAITQIAHRTPRLHARHCRQWFRVSCFLSIYPCACGRWVRLRGYGEGRARRVLRASTLAAPGAVGVSKNEKERSPIHDAS